MTRARLLAACLVLTFALVASTGTAKVVGENTEDLPPGCDEVSEEIELTVRGGTEPARGMDSVAFTFEERQWEVPACAHITVTFVNTDPIRHQFMVHGTYPDGSTLIELPGEGRDTATWIAPSLPASLMVHCGVAQHQQKGMKAQFLVDGGEGDVPNIPGISGLPEEDRPDAHVHGEEGENPIPDARGALAALALAIVGLSVSRRP